MISRRRAKKKKKRDFWSKSRFAFDPLVSRKYQKRKKGGKTTCPYLQLIKSDHKQNKLGILTRQNNYTSSNSKSCYKE